MIGVDRIEFDVCSTYICRVWDGRCLSKLLIGQVPGGTIGLPLIVVFLLVSDGY